MEKTLKEKVLETFGETETLDEILTSENQYPLKKLSKNPEEEEEDDGTLFVFGNLF